jgi:hypothetical protein
MAIFIAAAFMAAISGTVTLVRGDVDEDESMGGVKLLAPRQIMQPS